MRRRELILGIAAGTIAAPLPAHTQQKPMPVIGYLSGVSFLTAELHPKRFQLLSELVPQARLIAILVNPNNSSAERVMREVGAAADAKGVQLKALKVTAEADFSTAFASLAKLKAG